MNETIILIDSIDFTYQYDNDIRECEHEATYIKYRLIKGTTKLTGVFQIEHDITGYTVSQLAELVQKELERNQVI